MSLQLVPVSFPSCALSSSQYLHLLTKTLIHILPSLLVIVVQWCVLLVAVLPLLSVLNAC